LGEPLLQTRDVFFWGYSVAKLRLLKNDATLIRRSNRFGKNESFHP